MQMDLQTWAPWQQIQTPQTEQMGRQAPFVYALNETEILIMGGKKDGKLLNDVFEFNTETKKTTCLGDSGLATNSSPPMNCIDDGRGNIYGIDASRDTRRLIQATRDATSKTLSIKELKRMDDAENQLTGAPPQYDSNLVLNLNGIIELSTV